MPDIFKAIADPARREMLRLLARSPLNVNALAEHFPDISRPAVSQHLAVLEEAGAVLIYKAGRERYGCLNLRALEELQAWASGFTAQASVPNERSVLVPPANLADPESLTTPVMLQAMLTKDRAFDGRFYIGVKTTGIFCKPSCSASPKPENVSFFKEKSAAEKAGFRACKRCKP
ncbi:MAG: metalloregulator ArsR/SmtB family transcription factor [Saprospiraceae bacterium]